MAKSTGLALATGGIAIANEVLFAPIAEASSGDITGAVTSAVTSFNWRLVPATAVLALTLAGLEHLSVPFAVGLASLGLLAVLIVPIGNAPSVVDNLNKIMGV